MKKIFLILLLLISSSIFSQLKVTGYFNAEIGVSYQFSNKFQTELRVNDNINQEFNAEFSLLYKFIDKEDYNLNIGFGISTFLFKEFDKIESLFVPLQLEITPLKEYRNIAFVIESAFHKVIENEYGVRNSIGIRYIFN